MKNERKNVAIIALDYVLKFLGIFVRGMLAALTLYLITAMIRGREWAENTGGGLIDKLFRPLNKTYRAVDKLPEDGRHKVEAYDKAVERAEQLRAKTEELQNELASRPPTGWSWEGAQSLLTVDSVISAMYVLAGGTVFVGVAYTGKGFVSSWFYSPAQDENSIMAGDSAEKTKVNIQVSAELAKQIAQHVHKEAERTRHATAKMIDEHSAEERKTNKTLQSAIEHANESITMTKLELITSMERLEKLLHHDKGTRD